MAGHGEKLSRKQEKAVIALLSRPTVKQAAEEAGVDEKTLRRWMQADAFTAAWRAARRRTFEAALGRLQRLAARAVRSLAKNLTAPKSADQIRAAVAILRIGRAGIEVEDLAAEVERLQAEMEALKNGSGNDGQAGGETPPAGGPPHDGGGQPTTSGPSGGPGPDPPQGGDGAGRLAGGTSEIEFK